MREYARAMESALINYERELMDGAIDTLSVLVDQCTDDELWQMVHSGKLDLFMQKILFNIIRGRLDKKSVFRKFLDRVTGKA